MLGASLILTLGSACSSGAQEEGAPQGGAGAGSAGFPETAAGAPPAFGVGGEGGSAAGAAGAASDVGGEGSTANRAAVLPEGLLVEAHASGCSALELSALTLQSGSAGLELYAALKNVGSSAACSPAFSVSLFDRDEQPLAMGVGGLLVQSFYRLNDGSETLAACAAPGDSAMIAVRDLPADVRLEDVGRVEYWCNFWMLEATPVGGLRVQDVQRVERDGGVVYTAKLKNGLDVALAEPAVSVFQLDDAGRPLGVASASAEEVVPAGGSWELETEVVAERGVTQAAFPEHGP